jgi:hypothetical protein
VTIFRLPRFWKVLNISRCCCQFVLLLFAFLSSSAQSGMGELL